MTIIMQETNYRNLYIEDEGVEVVPSLSPDHHIWSVKEANSLLVNIQIVFMYSDKEEFSKNIESIILT